jgi:dTDP-4-amino-4,6-dideoxygalactose transaminase
MAQRLEAMTADYLGVPTRVVVSGDVGLTLTIAAMNIPKGSGCLVPSFTFNSTINAVLWNGLRPIFVDIDPETFNMDPVDARVAAAEAGDVGLVVATHVFGNPADADGLRSVADACGARLLFDAAHGYGASRNGVKVGGLGDAEVFSLSGTKPVTSAEGGLISTRDPDLLERITLLRGYGFYGDYNSKLVGLNGKMSELHAALGLLTMKRIDGALDVRAAHIDHYRSIFDGLPDVSFQRVRDIDRSTFKDFALVFADRERRDSVEAALGRADVQTKRYFRPCHGMDAFADWHTRPLPVTESLHGRILCVPLYESLSDAQIDEVATVVARSLSDARVPR